MMTMIKLLSAAAAVAMFAGTAQAADVDFSTSDSPSWTGGYIGAVAFPGPGGGLDVRSESDVQIDIVRASLNLRFSDIPFKKTTEWLPHLGCGGLCTRGMKT
jgi:hypothetical protein